MTTLTKAASRRPESEPSTDVRSVLVGLGLVTMTVQLAVALVLTLRLWTGHRAFGTSVWHGVFHSVSTFNNAGFALYPDSLMRFSGDWPFPIPVMAAIIIGGLCFPVLVDLHRVRRNLRALTVHSKVTLTATAALLVIGGRRRGR